MTSIRKFPEYKDHGLGKLEKLRLVSFGDDASPATNLDGGDNLLKEFISLPNGNILVATKKKIIVLNPKKSVIVKSNLFELVSGKIGVENNTIGKIFLTKDNLLVINTFDQSYSSSTTLLNAMTLKILFSKQGKSLHPYLPISDTLLLTYHSNTICVNSRNDDKTVQEIILDSGISSAIQLAKNKFAVATDNYIKVLQWKNNILAVIENIKIDNDILWGDLYERNNQIIYIARTIDHEGTRLIVIDENNYTIVHRTKIPFSRFEDNEILLDDGRTIIGFVSFGSSICNSNELFTIDIYSEMKQTFIPAENCSEVVGITKLLNGKVLVAYNTNLDKESKFVEIEVDQIKTFKLEQQKPLMEVLNGESEIAKLILSYTKESPIPRFNENRRAISRYLLENNFFQSKSEQETISGGPVIRSKI